jgi:hypothetical protein
MYQAPVKPIRLDEKKFQRENSRLSPIKPYPSPIYIPPHRRRNSDKCNINPRMGLEQKVMNLEKR